MTGRTASDYEQAVAELEAFGALPIDNTPPLSSTRFRAWLERRGWPDRAFHSVVVAGTCGKGSTATAIAAILRAAGHRVGLFTGPHLVRYTERVQVDGREMGGGAFAHRVRSLLDEAGVEAACGDPRRRPSVLEILAMAACLHFRERGVQWAVMEAGVGGWRDYTGALDPAACVLTAVDVDHAHLLGATVEAIAHEKAAIARDGVPLVCSARHAAARAVVRERCEAVGAPLLLLGDRFDVAATQAAPRWTRFDYRESGDHAESFLALRVSLAGRHQADNAAAAVACMRALHAAGRVQADEAMVRRGLGRVHLPGRLELRAGDPPVLLDGAHQPAGMAALRETLQTLYPGRALVLVLGVLADKDRERMVRLIVPAADRIVLTAPPWSARAGGLDAMTAWTRTAAQPHARVLVEPAVKEAMACARQEASDLTQRGERPLIVVTGSLYLVGAARLLS